MRASHPIYGRHANRLSHIQCWLPLTVMRAQHPADALELNSFSERSLGHEAVKTTLFLCTGNYYRSRFAEELFNHRAAQAGINWQAQSRALAIERGINNVGPLSPLALRGLTIRGVSANGRRRPPKQCAILDLENADYIVALNEVEHRSLMRERFPNWESRIHYWGIEDLPVLPADEALALIDAQVEALLTSFRRRQRAG